EPGIVGGNRRARRMVEVDSLDGRGSARGSQRDESHSQGGNSGDRRGGTGPDVHDLLSIGHLSVAMDYEREDRANWMDAPSVKARKCGGPASPLRQGNADDAPASLSYRA